MLQASLKTGAALCALCLLPSVLVTAQQGAGHALATAGAGSALVCYLSWKARRV